MFPLRGFGIVTISSRAECATRLHDAATDGLGTQTKTPHDLSIERGF